MGCKQLNIYQHLFGLYVASPPQSQAAYSSPFGGGREGASAGFSLYPAAHLAKNKHQQEFVFARRIINLLLQLFLLRRSNLPIKHYYEIASPLFKLFRYFFLKAGSQRRRFHYFNFLFSVVPFSNLAFCGVTTFFPVFNSISFLVFPAIFPPW